MVFSIIHRFILVDRQNCVLEGIHDVLQFYPLCTMVEAFSDHGEFQPNRFYCGFSLIFNCFFHKFLLLNYFVQISNSLANDKGGIIINMASMIIVGIMTYLLLLFIESGAFKRLMLITFKRVLGLFKRISSSNDMPLDGDITRDDDDDKDVLAERDRINDMTENELRSETLVMKNVSKFYGNLCAVDKISLAIRG